MRNWVALVLLVVAVALVVLVLRVSPFHGSAERSEPPASPVADGGAALPLPVQPEASPVPELADGTNGTKRLKIRMGLQASRRRLRAAMDLLTKGELDAALKEFQIIIDLSDDPVLCATAKWKKAIILLSQGETAEGVALLREVMEAQVLPLSDQFDVSLDLLRATIREGDAESVTTLLRAIEELFLERAGSGLRGMPSADRMYAELATLLWNNGMPDEALLYGRVAAGPESQYRQKAAIICAKVLESRGQVAEALALLAAAAGQGDTGLRAALSDVYYEMIAISLRSGDTDAAVRRIGEAVDRLGRDAGGMDFLYHAAQLLRGRSVDAWKEMMKTVAFSDRENVRMSALEELLSAARREGDWADVETYYQRMLSFPERPSWSRVEDYLHLMEAIHRQGKDISTVVDSLVSYLDKATDVDTKGLYRIAKEMQAVGLDADAEAFSRKVLALGGADAWTTNARIQLADLLARTGKPGEAAELYWSYIRQCQEDGDPVRATQGLLKLIGSGALGKGGAVPADIERLLAGGIQQIPDVDSLLALIVFLQNQGRNDLAKQCLTRAVSIADSDYAAGKTTVAQRRAHEDLITKRMYELEMFPEVADRVENLPDELAPKESGDLRAYLDLQYRMGSALWREQVAPDEAQAVFDQILKLAQGNAALFPEFAVNIGFHYIEADPALMNQLFQQAVAMAPANPYAGLARLYIAAEKFKQQDVQFAVKEADAVLANTDPNSLQSWERDLYWSAKYLQGAAAYRNGDSAGQAAMKEAERNGEIWWFLRNLR